MKIVVIGGAGFIGGHIVDRLKVTSDVIVYDIYKPENLHPAGSFEYIFGDILDENRLRMAVKWADVVYHLAGISNTGKCMAGPKMAVETNCIGTVNVLKACLEMGVGKVIIAGTSLIGSLLYPLKLLYNRDLDLIDVRESRHIYVTTKIFQEMITRDFSVWDLPHTIFRFGICYGPRMTPGVVVHNFIKNALGGKPLQVHGDGLQERPYIYIHDLVDACVKAISKKANNKTYNIVPDKLTCIKDIADAVNSILPVGVQYTPSREYDFERVHELCSDELKHDLGWKQKTMLQDGIKETIDYYRRHGF
jgi:UDP-glucose 4-epimerase